MYIVKQLFKLFMIRVHFGNRKISMFPMMNAIVISYIVDIKSMCFLLTVIW